MYFADDDNTYSLELFEEMRKINKVMHEYHISSCAILLDASSSSSSSSSTPLYMKYVLGLMSVILISLRVKVGVWMVAFSGGLLYEGPIIENNVCVCVCVYVPCSFSASARVLDSITMVSKLSIIFLLLGSRYFDLYRGCLESDWVPRGMAT